MKQFAKLYLSTIDDNLKVDKLSNPIRNKEIDGCTNEKVKKEKYAVFKLFEYALKDTFNENFSSKAYKDTNGKWKIDGLELSFSHSDGVVAVLISDTVCGVDVERVDRFINKENLSTKLFGTVLEAEKLCDLWTKKESVFKSLDEKRFIPEKIDIDNKLIKTIFKDFFGKRYCISACGDSVNDLTVKIV